MNGGCPASCEMIQHIITINKLYGKLPKKELKKMDFYKRHCIKCFFCLRNEFATMPMADMSGEKGSENNA